MDVMFFSFWKRQSQPMKIIVLTWNKIKNGSFGSSYYYDIYFTLFAYSYSTTGSKGARNDKPYLERLYSGQDAKTHIFTSLNEVRNYYPSKCFLSLHQKHGKHYILAFQLFTTFSSRIAFKKTWNTIFFSPYIPEP